jgi:DNA-binding transcriptional MerR regulator
MEERLTIDELAHAAGMTVRNVRSHQTRGLLPPPELRGRTGYYGPEHTARLRLIKDMQGAGFNLRGIKHMVESIPEGGGEDALRFERALMAPWSPERPEVVGEAELMERFGGAGPVVLERAEELGVIVPLGDGRYEIPVPRLLRAGQEVLALGVPADQMLETLGELVSHANGVAESFVELFMSSLWRPFGRAGKRAEQWPRIMEALERLRPLASEVLVAAFQVSMRRAVEEAFESELKRRAGDGDDRLD